jgi:hypothetical protein
VSGGDERRACCGGSVHPSLLRVLTMIEDKLAKHYQADALPVGHPVREAIAELRRLRGERDALLAEVERLRAELEDIGDHDWMRP